VSGIVPESCVVPASPTTTHALALQTSGLAQSSVRVHDSPRPLPRTLLPLSLLLQPGVPSIPVAPRTKTKNNPDFFMFVSLSRDVRDVGCDLSEGPQLQEGRFLALPNKESWVFHLRKRQQDRAESDECAPERGLQR